MKVKEVMSRNPVCCASGDASKDIARLMKQNNIGSIPVVKGQSNRELVGTVTDRDICLKVVGDALPAETPVERVMTRHVITCHADDPLELCESLMQEHQVRRIPVVDDKGHCIGMVAQADVALRDDARHTKQTVSAISEPHSLHKGKHPPAAAMA